MKDFNKMYKYCVKNNITEPKEQAKQKEITSCKRKGNHEIALKLPGHDFTYGKLNRY